MQELGPNEFAEDTPSETALSLNVTDNYDLETVASLPFSEKWSWFLAQMQAIQEPWSNGHIRLEVERSDLVRQSCQQVLLIGAQV